MQSHRLRSFQRNGKNLSHSFGLLDGVDVELDAWISEILVVGKLVVWFDLGSFRFLQQYGILLLPFALAKYQGLQSSVQFVTL